MAQTYIIYMKYLKPVAFSAVAGIAILATVAVFNSKSGGGPVENGQEQLSGEKKSKTASARKPRNAKAAPSKQRIEQAKAKAQNKKKPAFALDDDDEAKLNEEQRRTIEAIRAALDDNSKKTVLKLVQKLQASDEWPDGIPKSIKMAAIEALGWFGSSCLPEIAGFLGDADPEVVQSATEKYEEALADFELSDRERAQILIQAAKVINDPDAMDSMLFELNNMRHSVAVETIKTLMVDGNAATKQALPENIETVTGEEGMNTPEKLDEWLKENPDGEDDDDFYGGTKEA